MSSSAVSTVDPRTSPAPDLTVEPFAVLIRGQKLIASEAANLNPAEPLDPKSGA